MSLLPNISTFFVQFFTGCTYCYYLIYKVIAHLVYLKVIAIFFILLFEKALMEESQKCISIKSQPRPFSWGGRRWTFFFESGA